MSETINLKLLKHDNVETNTEMFDIEKYLNENWDKIDEDVGTINTEISNIQAINKEHSQIIDTKVDKVSGKGLSTNDFTNEYKTKLDKLQNYNDSEVRNEVAEINKKDTEQDGKMEELQNEKLKLEKELKEVQEDFYQASVRGQASGEYIHVEDSSNCRAKIGISGNSEQETRKGYNQFKIQSSATSNNGVTITKNSDSSVTYSGTTTGAFTHTLVQYNNLEVTKKLYLKNCGTLTNANFIVQLIRSGKTSVEYITIQSDIILNVGDIIQKIYVQQQLTGKALSGTCNILLTDYENKDKGYEQYGAMPSPDYCSEIKTVGSNVNLFDITRKADVTGQNAINGLGDSSYIKTDDSYVLNNRYKSFGFKFNNLKIGKTYTLKFKTEVTGFKSEFKTVQLQLGINMYQGSTATTKKQDVMGIGNDKIEFRTFSFVCNDEQNIIAFGTYATTDLTGIQIKISNIKLVEGTEVGEYSNYDQGSIKVIKCNKNLVIKKNITQVSSGLTSTTKNGYIITVNGTASEDWADITDENNRNYFSDSIKAGQTITFSRDSNEYNLFIVLYYEDGKSEQKVIGKNSYRHTMALEKNLKGYRLFLQGFSKATVFNNYTFKFQIEINDAATEIIEPQEESYIVPVQKKMLEGDYFDFDNEEEVHVWKKYEITGNENISIINELTNTVRFDITIPNIGLTDTKSISNYFKTTTFGNRQQDVIQLNTYTNQIMIRMNKNTYSNIEQFKVWLKVQYDAGTPVIAYYKLATPNRLKFTDEQKLVAKELKNARTYKNVTNITTDSKAIISLNYAKDTETEHNKMQKEIDEIKQLLSTTQTSAMLLDNLQKEVESEV